MNVQLNVKTTSTLIEELDKLVKEGYFKDRSEAVNEALRVLIRMRKFFELEKKIEKIKEETEGYPSLSKIVEKIHEEEDKA